jgi:type I restriction enzyme R subunit
MSHNEADTRSKLIDPAIYVRGWTEDHIKREESAGTIEIVAGKAKRNAKGKVDYTLRLRVASTTQPVAVAIIEAKAEGKHPGHGLEQAKAYAACKRLNVPFAFSSNGHQFVEFDRFTGVTSAPRPMTEFPTPDDLRRRYEKGMGFSLDSLAAKPLLVTYQGGEAGRRYYQDAAIRAVLEKIARCDVQGEPKRALLSLATGAGKTFIAVNLLKKIADAGQLRRALFVGDRDELRTQGLAALQKVFGSDAMAASGSNPEKNARVVVASYQTLDVDSDEDDANFLTKNYPQNYFSHIVIDECHRSAWGKWSQVLTRNANAVQVGLTATPRKIKLPKGSKEAETDAQICADNYKHFGEPVYEYDMAQAIEDGYLAACEIIKGRVSLDEQALTREEILKRKVRDAKTGKEVGAESVKEEYEKFNYEGLILLPNRVRVMCRDLFKYLCETGGPEQKTIIFCARDRHADDVARRMNNRYAAWCRQQGKARKTPYAFKCTSANDGNDYLPDLKGASRYHFIATTVDLLTTGIDVPCIRNIVFFKYVKSPISFYQMIGRGTRIDIPTDKLMFRVYDYTNATRLFGEDFVTPPPRPPGPGGGGGDGPTIIQVEGFYVAVTPAGRYIVTRVDGKAMPVTVEDYEARMAEKLKEEAKSIEEFRAKWIEPVNRQPLIDRLVTSGYNPRVLRMVKEMEAYDLYDVLVDAAYGTMARTRHDRTDAFTYKNEEWLALLPVPASAVIKAVARQFEMGGTEGLENKEIFRTSEVTKAGGLAGLKAAGNPAELLKETKARMFAA